VRFANLLNTKECTELLGGFTKYSRCNMCGSFLFLFVYIHFDIIYASWSHSGEKCLLYFLKYVEVRIYRGTAVFKYAIREVS
jgi:hypothetical protein